MARRWILILILAGYFVLGTLFAVNTPAWQAPDEPAHYNYIAYVAENGNFPVLHFGDYPHAYLEQIKAAKFPPNRPVTPIRYESHQPPLYYVLAAPVYSLARGSLTVLRLLSLVLGAGIVVLAYGVAQRALPGRPAVALAAAAFVAFLPQHLATVSQVGNDVLAELLYAAMLFLLVGLLAPATSTSPSPRRTPLLLGILLGLILVTKTTAYIAAPLVFGVYLWRWFRERASARQILLGGLSVLLPAALIAVPWYARNITVYGWPDFLGLMRHDQIVVGQMRTGQYVAENGWGAYWQRAAEWTFKSFTGVFGWMGVWLDSRVYYLLGLWLSVPVVAALAGLTGRKSADADASQHSLRPAIVLLTLSAFLTLLTYIYYNISFLQHQGRYLFTALIPIAIFLATGWEQAVTPRIGRIVAGVLLAWAAILAVWGLWFAPPPATGVPEWLLALTVAVAMGLIVASLLPERWRRWAYVAPFALLPLVSLYALFGAIIPQLAR